MPARYLPENFLTQVFGFIALRLQPKLGVERAARFDGRGCTILTNELTEKTVLIDWQNSVFGLSNSTICTMTRTVDAEAVLQGFLVQAARSDCPPILPNGNQGDAAKQEMRRTINAVGETRWLATARYYLQKEFYLMPNGNPKWDSFGELAHNFATYDTMRVQDERKAAEQKQREEKALAVWRKQQADAEAEYQERVCVAEELRVKKERVWTYLRLCDQIIAIMRDVDSDESETAFFKGVLARANTVATVHEIHAAVELLHKCLREELLAGKPFAKPRDDEFEVSDF